MFSAPDFYAAAAGLQYCFLQHKTLETFSFSFCPLSKQTHTHTQTHTSKFLTQTELQGGGEILWRGF